MEDLAALPSLSRFFDTHLVLFYRNGEEWYDVHPLVGSTFAPRLNRSADAVPNRSSVRLRW